MQITSGSTLNVPDRRRHRWRLAARSARYLVRTTLTAKRYLLQQEVVTLIQSGVWAGLATADIDLYEKALLTGS